jgi:hypothetical protein
MTTTLTELRRELSKRIGLFHGAPVNTGDATMFRFADVGDADGHWDNSWAWPTSGPELSHERLVRNYSGAYFIVYPAWDSGPNVGDDMEVHQFRPTMLTDLLNWARGDAFPNVGILAVVELSAADVHDTGAAGTAGGGADREPARRLLQDRGLVGLGELAAGAVGADRGRPEFHRPRAPAG